MTLRSETMTLADRLEACDGRTTGFDYLRLGLALGVFVWHLQSTSVGRELALATWHSWGRAFPTVILPMFFVLSGFLVSGSLERCRTLGYFIFLRAIRIFPALAVEVLLSAIILGSMLTVLPLWEYLTDPRFFDYLLNVLGIISMELPGVFENNPWPGVVNGQLWTVPYELECYIALSMIAFFGAYRSESAAKVLLIPLSVFFLLSYTDASNAFGHVSGRGLVAYFLLGVIFYRLRNSIPYDQRLFWLALVASLVGATLSGGGYLIFIPLTYVTVWIGLQSWRLPRFMTWGDYSYGIFLYHVVVQQTIVSQFDWARNMVLNGMASLVVTVAVAMLSWHLVERPLLGTKHRAKRLESAYLRARSPELETSKPAA